MLGYLGGSAIGYLALGPGPEYLVIGFASSVILGSSPYIYYYARSRYNESQISNYQAAMSSMLDKEIIDNSKPVIINIPNEKTDLLSDESQQLTSINKKMKNYTPGLFSANDDASRIVEIIDDEEISLESSNDLSQQGPK